MNKPWLKHWPEGVPYSINYPNIPVNAFLENAAAKYPNQTALIFLGKRISYSDLGNAAARFANVLQHLGISKGDRVAIILPNVPPFVIAYYGTLQAGGIVVAINPLSEISEIARQIEDSGAKITVVLDRFLKKIPETKLGAGNVIVARAEDYLPLHLKMLSRLSEKSRVTKNYLLFENLLRQHSPFPKRVSLNPSEDLAIIQYTGGTTGTAKGVMLTHYNLVANTIQTFHWLRGWGLSRKPQKEGRPIVLAAVPLFHIYGMTVALNEAIHAGSTIVLIPKPEARYITEAIEKNHVTHLPATPNIYREIVQHQSVNRKQLRSLTHCVSGGDPVDEEIVDRFKELSEAQFYEGYGLTEASPVTHCTVVDEQSLTRGSIGIPFPDTDARIVDQLTGEESVPTGKEGELAVKGPQVMKGYLNLEDETRRAIRDGWLYTGDIGTMDEEGFFRIIDRKQDRIITQGHTIWPSKVEAVLLQHPSVGSAAVVGSSDPMRCATNVEAFVVLKPNMKLEVDRNELVRYCREKLEDYQVPDEIEIVEELPRTPLVE